MVTSTAVPEGACFGQRGLDNHFIGSEPDIPSFLDSTPAAKTMNSALKKYADSSTIKSPDYNEQATQMWDSGLLFAAAAKAGGVGADGTATAAQVLNGLYKLRAVTLGGMTPPITYHRGKPTPIDCWYWIGIKSGKFTTPYGLKPVCVTPPPVS